MQTSTFGVYVLVAGLLVGVTMAPIIPTIWYGAFLLAVLVIVGTALHRFFNRSYTYESFLLLTVLFCVMVGLGALRVADLTAREQVSPLMSLVNSSTTIQGIIAVPPVPRTTHTQFIVKTDKGDRILLRAPRHQQIYYGDAVTVSGKLERPEPFVTDTGRLFPYDGYLKARGISYVMNRVEPVVTNPAGFSVIGMLHQTKQYFIERLEQVLPYPAVGLGLGMLLGVDDSLGERIEDDFRTAGLSHIVVLSGYNLMVIVGFVLLVTAWLPWRVRILIATVLVVLFLLMVGYSPSVWRAGLMALILLFLWYLGRPYLVLRALTLVVGIMVWYSPATLWYDVGFQLSCLATLGLIALGKLYHTKTFTLRTYLLGIVAASIAAQVAVLPLILYAMGTWSPVAIPTNFIVAPLVPVAMLLTFVTGTVALLSLPLASLVAPFAQAVLSSVIAIATTATSLPLPVITLAPFSPLVPVTLYGVMIGFFVWWYQKSKALQIPTVFSHLASDTRRWQIVEEDVVIDTTKR